MTGRPVPPADLLQELLPTVERAFARHLAVASEWFPHEFVPYEEGRNYLKEPWRPSDSELPDIAQTSLEVNLLTEDNLPYYHLSIWRAFRGDDPWEGWVRRWTAEEGRHSIVLRDFLTVTRGLDPAALERGRMEMVSRGWYPTFAEAGPLDGLMFTAIQELATRIAHRNTGELTGDELIQRLCARIATDENLHYVFYRDMAAAALQADPSAGVLALHRQVVGFQMPGADMPGFHEKAKEMARAGVYNLRIHHDQVLRPLLEQHWRIAELDGLTDAAERAREEIFRHVGRIDRVAARLGDPLGPVVDDLSDDPPGAP